MIRTLIVDDEPLARQYIRRLLEEDAEIEIVGECGNGREALEFIRARMPDLIFLDIQMPEMNGFDFLKSLGGERLPAVIFATAYEQFAIRAFEFHALDYLLKPFDEERFAKALAHARKILADRGQRAQESMQIKELVLAATEERPQFLKRLLIKQNGRIVFLRADEIDWIKADDKYVHIYSGKTSHLVRQTLAAMRAQLDPQMFVQIHRSAIVNVERIVELEPLATGDYVVVLEGGARAALGRNFRDELFERLGKPL